MTAPKAAAGGGQGGDSSKGSGREPGPRGPGGPGCRRCFCEGCRGRRSEESRWRNAVCLAILAIFWLVVWQEFDLQRIGRAVARHLGE